MKDQMDQNQKLSHKNCGLSAFQHTLGGKWKTSILWVIREYPFRFSDLRRSLEGVTESMLTKQLRELERDGYIYRKIYPEVPPHVEYSITALGISVLSLLVTINQWGEENILKNDPE